MNDNNETLPKTPITKEQFDQVCELLSTSNTSLNSACNQLHIAKQSVYKYIEITDRLNGNSDCKNQYARIKEDQIETMIDEMQDVEEECLQAVESTDDPKRANAIVQAYKLKIDNLKWIASKLKAKKYGDKLDITSNNESISRQFEIIPVSNNSTNNAKSIN